MRFPVFVTSLVASASICNARILHFYKREVIDTGSCGSPGIEFAFGLDGRTEAAFQPINETAFPHGSADNIGVITGFITQQLQDRCKAPSGTLTIAAQASAAANAATKGGAQADAWNAAFGLIVYTALIAINNRPTLSLLAQVLRHQLSRQNLRQLRTPLKTR